jgi:hypothetical protein
LSYYSTPSFSYDGNIITLNHNTGNVENFLGYDIYYRAYQLKTAADSARTAIESAASSTSTTQESVLSQLKTAGFMKVYLSDFPTTEQVPLIRVSSPSTAIKYIIQPSNASKVDWYYKSSTSSETVGLVRGTLSSEPSFSKPYLVGDADYSSSNAAIQSGKTVYLVFFAVAYGIKDSDLTAIYSMPASLYTTVEYTLP